MKQIKRRMREVYLQFGVLLLVAIVFGINLNMAVMESFSWARAASMATLMLPLGLLTRNLLVYSKMGMLCYLARETFPPTTQEES